MYVRRGGLFWGLWAWLALVPLGVGDVLPAPPKAKQPAPAADSDQPDSPRPGPLVLEDPPQPLVEKHPRTEADRDRLEALSLFSAGRMAQRQQRYPEALRYYQRALRCDPQSVTVARSIVPLAVRLKRYAQAVRYALKMAEMEDPDPPTLQRLGRYLIEIGDFKGAAKLYEKAMAAEHGTPETARHVQLRMEMGRLYHLVEEYGKAADCFARVRDALENPKQFGLDDQMKKLLLGEPGPTYNLLGECFLRADRADEALAAFQKAHDLAPQKALWHFHLARVHAHRKQSSEALADLEACFQEKQEKQEKLAGEGTAPYELLAKVLEDLGKRKELIGRLERLRREDPKNLPLGYFLAQAYLEAEQFARAEPLYRELIDKTPTLTGYRSLIEICRRTERADALLDILGEAVGKTGGLELLGAEAKAVAGEAPLMRLLIEAARKKHQAAPESLDYGMRLAVALLALESKQFDTAGEFFDLALKAKSDQAAELLLVWGVGLLLGERPAEAVRVFRRAIDEKVLPEDNPAFSYYLAGALAMDDQTDQALAEARKAADRARTAAQKAAEEAGAAQKALAAAAGNKTEEGRAEEKVLLAAQTATKKKEDWVRFSSRVGWVLYHAKRNDEAVEAYRKLIEEFDSDHQSSAIRDVLREVRLALSNLDVLKEDLSAAEEWLQQVLDEFPDDVGASNDLGYLWADQGKHLQRSLKMIQHAIRAEPDNVAYRDSLGWVFYRLGRYPEAVAELQKALQQHKKNSDEEPDPIILDHLGDAYRKANQPQKAKHAWRRAVEAFQKQEEPEKAKTVQEKIDKPG